MKSKICDLHTHSYFSDGTYTPTELVDEAWALGLSHIALCDHNTTAGLAEFMEAAEGKSIVAIPGVELSTDYGETELHILALFIKPEHYGKIEALVEEMQRRKDESNIALIDALRSAGFNIEFEEILSQTKGHINRAHVAAALAEKGYAPSVKAAFNDYLLPKRGYYIPPKRLPVFETIAFIKSIGAVAVLAHPFLSFDNAEELRAFLKKAKSFGLDGMETRYSTYDNETEVLATKIAEEFGLLEGGGSDFHGDKKPDISLGVGKGSLAVPDAFAKKLAARAKSNSHEINNSL